MTQNLKLNLIILITLVVIAIISNVVFSNVRTVPCNFDYDGRKITFSTGEVLDCSEFSR
jgi:hypothetical protein